jgi:stage II sporulation protein AA (anti-sigma F factor antagonist)
MKIDSARDGHVATLALDGLIETRAAQELEKHVVGLFGDGVRSVVVDLSKVDLITSAGIRVLVMMAQRLQRSGGGLVLCALSAKVRGVFDIAGLLAQFRIVDTRADAAAQLAALETREVSSAPARVSKLTALVCDLLEEDSASAAAGTPPAGGSTPSTLAVHVRDLLQSLDPPAARR